MNCKNKDSMKNLFLIFFLLTTIPTFCQQWISANDFKEKVTGYGAYEDHSDHDVIVVEFWADFNKQNSFKDWKKIDNLNGVKYYRVNIANSPKLKKELRIRMAPTILIYIRGDSYIKFTAKAYLDLKCPVDYNKLSKAIETVKQEASY